MTSPSSSLSPIASARTKRRAASRTALPAPRPIRAICSRIEQDGWEGDRLSFAAAALGQHAHGTIDVGEGAVRLEVTLPWLLARFAQAVQRVVGQRGQLLLEKK